MQCPRQVSLCVCVCFYFFFKLKEGHGLSAQHYQLALSIQYVFSLQLPNSHTIRHYWTGVH